MMEIWKITEFPRITSHSVAKRFEIKDRGFIREGFWADLSFSKYERLIMR